MKEAILIDGGYLRAVSKLNKQRYNANFIESFAKKCVGMEDTIWRIFYYDCPPYEGRHKSPDGNEIDFSTSKSYRVQNKLFQEIAEKELFALRKGVLKFRGWEKIADPKSQEDFRPNFVQKGVDMRIGLDVATLSIKKVVDRIILVSGDTDMIPAMKYARIEGLQVCVVQIKNCGSLHPNLLEHADLIREVKI